MHEWATNNDREGGRWRWCIPSLGTTSYFTHPLRGCKNNSLFICLTISCNHKVIIQSLQQSRRVDKWSNTYHILAPQARVNKGSQSVLKEKCISLSMYTQIEIYTTLDLLRSSIQENLLIQFFSFSVHLTLMWTQSHFNGWTSNAISLLYLIHSCK